MDKDNRATPALLERGFFLDWVRLADQAGFDTLGSLDRPNYDMWDPLASLAGAAAVTQRIRLASTTLPAAEPQRGAARQGRTGRAAEAGPRATDLDRRTHRAGSAAGCRTGRRARLRWGRPPADHRTGDPDATTALSFDGECSVNVERAVTLYLGMSWISETRVLIQYRPRGAGGPVVCQTATPA